MNAKLPALILALIASSTLSAVAGGKIWVALYQAEDTPPPPGVIMASEKMTHRLRAVFGFRHYELVQKQEIELGKEWEQWAVPRRDFFIRLLPLPRQPGEPRMVDYQLFKDGNLVAKGLYEPHEETPLFINGPDLGPRRLIFVLEAH